MKGKLKELYFKTISNNGSLTKTYLIGVSIEDNIPEEDKNCIIMKTLLLTREELKNTYLEYILIKKYKDRYLYLMNVVYRLPTFGYIVNNLNKLF